MQDFSTTTQGANGFYYGEYTTPNDPTTYTNSSFTYSGGEWQPPAGFPYVVQDGGHPAGVATGNTGDSVRRYSVASDTDATPGTAGPVTIQGHFSKSDACCINDENFSIYLNGVALPFFVNNIVDSGDHFYGSCRRSQ